MNRTYLPPACYTLSRKEKKVFCQTLAELKALEGYCSNFRNLVSMEDLKLCGLKSHDYHTLMQQLLPVALRSLLPKHVHESIKGYVRNRNHPEGCIVECYIAEEAIEFCTEYLSNVDAIGVPSSTNVDHKVGAPITGGHITEVDCNLLLQAHHYVLENTTIIQPYIEEHMKWLKLNNPRQSKRQKWLQEEHMRTFTHWLRKKVEVAIADKEPISETLRWMAHGPTHYVAKYHGYVINGSKDSDDFMDNSIEHHPLITTLAQVESFDTMDDSDVICIRGDCEGFWIDNKSSISKLMISSSIRKKFGEDLLAWIQRKRKPLHKKKYRGTTRKSMIIRKRNRGIKLVIKYNADGIYVGESSVHLTSYLGVLARMMNTLTVKHILPFKDEPELLKKPPAEYHFIDDEDWNIFVKNRLSEKFQEYREVQKQRRKKHIYNHHLSRKGYAGLEEEMMIEAGSTKSIDRSLLWKRAMRKKDGSYDDVVLPVVEKIVKSQESGISYSGSNDILSQALGTPEYIGRVPAKGKHYTPGRYFNSMSERVVRDILKATQERQVKFEADVLARLSQIGVATPQSDVSSSNMKSKLLLLPEVVEKPIRKVEEDTLPVKIEPHMKARKCELVVGTRENTVAGGTIVMDCGPNYLVVLDAPYESYTPLPIPIPGQATTVGAAVGYQVLWPTHLVNLSTKFIKGSHKGKRQKTTENDLKIGENPQDINNFDALVGLMLNEGKAQALVSKVGMGETTKKNRSRLIANRLMHAKRVDYIFIPYNPDFHRVLVALDMRTMTAYYLDPMQKQPCDDLKEIVNMALRIHPLEKQRSSKREPTWVKVVCPRQLGSVECGYYVMRYMKDIIVDPSLLSTKMPSFQSSKSCRSHFDDSHKFSSHDK
ncbi:hypothetical protein CK203_057234 [Vitis vinifera]|uniref:Ubiquitin-like protease family profile domain-containing protein n=1 Tax=Vitis vinifera TaxID=29760 RepID=A0A438HT95_VITVI|nr:hypothetical protein CK203_057234 [Vitis vinifera]